MKKFRNKILSIILCVLLTLPTLAFVGCDKGVTFRISNCEDYIDEDLLDEFEDYYEQKTGVKINVEYTTFGTLEELYTNIKRGDKYDLVCPSDYMIEKMAREGMLKPLNLDANGTYNTTVSPFIKSTLESVKWGENNEYSLATYSAGYMWGTLGLVYNDAKISNKNDMKSWSSLWNSAYEDKFTIKNSMRDTYFIGLAKHFKTELETQKSLYQAGLITLDEYQTRLSGYFNNCESSVINAVETQLQTLKSKSWGLEVDSGKNDIVLGNTDIYFAWSGDAVYAMDEAEEDGVILNYEVPEEGSNIWFDGWCIPSSSSNEDIASEFIEFVSLADSVTRNMDYIGYVSCIAGNDIFDYVVDAYGVTNGEYEVDLGYFFGDGNYVVKTDTIGRQFSAQYPSKDVIDRCVIMNYFNDTANELITTMWTKISVA
ncbi:MAG: extracellular solute-binding protein [Clostridia bacterium]|nr:extracellular solute-binding protein [Clostridia bacterium]